MMYFIGNGQNARLRREEKEDALTRHTKPARSPQSDRRVCVHVRMGIDAERRPVRYQEFLYGSVQIGSRVLNFEDSHTVD
jgi:hypothetical protein